MHDLKWEFRMSLSTKDPKNQIILITDKVSGSIHFMPVK